MTDTCSTCRFWAGVGTGCDFSQCRRNAPTLSPNQSSWPMTSARDWCGEFARLPIPPTRPEPDGTIGEMAKRLGMPIIPERGRTMMGRRKK